MALRNSQNYTIFDAIGILTAAFTAATTNVITSATHGLSNGNMVVLTTTGTLPAGLSLATVYYVRDAATNTFKLALTPEGPEIDVTGTGTGTHTFTMHDIGKSIFIQDFTHAILALSFVTTPTMTVKIQGSIEETCPDFSAAQSASNHWDYIDIIDLQNGTSIDGDTGVACTGTADYRLFEINVNGLRYVNAIISGWSAGTVTLKIQLFEN